MRSSQGEAARPGCRETDPRAGVALKGGHTTTKRRSVPTRLEGLRRRKMLAVRSGRRAGRPGPEGPQGPELVGKGVGRSREQTDSGSSGRGGEGGLPAGNRTDVTQAPEPGSRGGPRPLTRSEGPRAGAEVPGPGLCHALSGGRAHAASRIQMFSQEKKKRQEKEHKYIFLRLHHPRTGGRNSGGAAGKGGCAPNIIRGDKCHLGPAPREVRPAPARQECAPFGATLGTATGPRGRGAEEGVTG